jgi:hypothetical protein
LIEHIITYVIHPQRGRAYLISCEPCGTYIAGPDGNARRHIEAHGCPVFSLGEPYYSEMMLPKGYKTIVSWFEEVAAEPGYANPEFMRYDEDADEDADHEAIWTEPGIEVRS